jgi:hypothetical protein
MNEYVICSYYLYDNNKETDYIILSDRDVFIDSPFNKIYSLKSQLGDTEEFRNKSIELMEQSCEYQKRFGKCIMIKNDGIMKTNQIIESTTYNPSYNGYDLIWDEGKSGINPFEYDHFIVWNVGQSSISNYLIQGNIKNRDFIVRDNVLNSILE